MKFIDELKKAKEHLMADTSTAGTEASRKYKEMRRYYSDNIGKKALFKSGREERVVTIQQAAPTYVLLSYNVYGSSQTTIRVTSSYNSLICGDDRLEVEE